MTLTSQLISTCFQRLPGQIDEGALRMARLSLIDSLAVAYAAYGERPIDMLRSLSTEGQTEGESTVIGYGERGRATDVSLVNGMMISLQLFDDNHELMRGHPSGPLLPAVLSVAESRGLTLGEAMRAFVIGYEVECRLGILLNPSHYELGWHATATQGAVASAVASGLLLGLNESQMAYALGIVASLASGIRRNFGTMTMSLHSGMAASQGVRAAKLAALGFSADPNVFENPRGYGAIFSPEWTDAALQADLAKWGKDWMIKVPTFKLYPCGRPNLFGIDAALALRAKEGFRVEDIERIVCDVSYMYPRTVVHSRPVNGLQGKTSLEYCVATTLMNGRPTLADFTDEAVHRPHVRALLDRTEMRVPPELSEDIPAVRKAPFEQPVTVNLHMRDGRHLSEVVHVAKGSPTNPTTEEELNGKFTDCAVPNIGQARALGILATLGNSTLPVRDLMASLIVRR